MIDELFPNPLRVEATAVVANLDLNMAALVKGPQRDGSDVAFARVIAHFWRLYAVVRGVANHMRQRVAHILDELPIQFGVVALQRQVYPLAEIPSQVAYQARQFAPGLADRLHARFDDILLQLGRDVVQALKRWRETRILLGSLELEQLIARQNKLRDRRH